MNPLQAIVFTWRSYFQSRRLQQQHDEVGIPANTWYESEDERYADEVGDLIAEDLANVRIDARQRTFMFNKKARIGLKETLKRLQSLHPDVDRNVLESELLFWIEQTSEPEGDGSGFTQEQMDEHNQTVENWFDDYHRDSDEKSDIVINS